MNEKFNIYGNEINIKYSSPEIGISENFDYINKHFYMTKGINNIFILENEIQKGEIASNIINKIYERAKIEELDFLLKIEINGIETWIIDNGRDICLMLPEEY